MNKPANSTVHSTAEGKLYINEQEFFSSARIKEMVQKLLNSSVYTHIKAQQRGETKN